MSEKIITDVEFDNNAFFNGLKKSFKVPCEIDVLPADFTRNCPATSYSNTIKWCGLVHIYSIRFNGNTEYYHRLLQLCGGSRKQRNEVLQKIKSICENCKYKHQR